MPYTDVFISHKAEDTAKAKQLQSLIKSWSFDCWIDADDQELQRIRASNDPRRMAEHIRQSLRDCRVLLYAFSLNSGRSRWMPWELGFFDGRWGQLQIALYDLDERPRSKLLQDEKNVQKSPDDPMSLQEYLKIYPLCDRRSLRPFLDERTSTRALADRADVDVDRLGAMLAGAMRNPLDFALGSTQYALALQQEFWHRAGFPTTQAMSGRWGTIEGLQKLLGGWRAWAASLEPREPSAAGTDDVARGTAKAHEGAIKATAH
jgi:hypothetical protein